MSISGFSLSLVQFNLLVLLEGKLLTFNPGSSRSTAMMYLSLCVLIAVDSLGVEIAITRCV